MSTKTEQKVQLVAVDEANDGQRIDNFLISRLKGVPKNMVYRLLRTGQVRVNKGRKKPSYKLHAGDQVRLPPHQEPASTAAGTASNSDLQRLQQNVLYEDDALLVVNKPSGMAVHGGSGLSYGVIEAFRQLRPQCRFLELVHRLDRDTSGCLILAKKRQALVKLHAMLRQEHGDSMDKTYLALVQGCWQGKKQRVDLALKKNVRQSGERVVLVADDGKPAVSIIAARQNFSHQDAALVEIRLITGRTHQARVHAAAIGHPIAGDQKYGDREFNRAMRQVGLRRLFLHAWRLRFRHPLQDRLLEIEAPLPHNLSMPLEQLK